MVAKIKRTRALTWNVGLLRFLFGTLAFAKGPSEPEFGVLRVWSAKDGETHHVAGPGEVIVAFVDALFDTQNFMLAVRNGFW